MSRIKLERTPARERTLWFLEVFFNKIWAGIVFFFVERIGKVILHNDKTAPLVSVLSKLK
jgi:hypothetical protein